ncbi:zinc ribbon domain-containing protein [Nostoc sp.]|uniref:zinc ribbon domain-containing protein n=1 Tax=Nostoc sp. TaxID=1180 RepID=UPI003FA5E4BB
MVKLIDHRWSVSGSAKFFCADCLFGSFFLTFTVAVCEQEISLSERIYVCQKCQHIADRDLNASQNLEKYARKALPCLDVEG